jgi:hypothetical protein
MFTHRKFEVEIARKVNAQGLDWPARGEAGNDTGLGCNRMYRDLRRLTWANARRVLSLETDLIAKIEATFTGEEDEALEEELLECETYLYGLDLGVASAVASLSAAGCVPFSSCNAGAFGGDHQERCPLVAFYAPARAVELLIASAEEAGIGLEGNKYLVAYADDIQSLGRFARSLIGRSSAFTAQRRTIKHFT